ncbi:uncharacterized protein BDW70DRAFT_113342 [Aspergillus foveolatus]|uniref:uncharacterized protein n=1 Tax=Aspergillus foveolatus TaxID=210207 RepID=UPI003CCDF966
MYCIAASWVRLSMFSGGSYLLQRRCRSVTVVRRRRCLVARRYDKGWGSNGLTSPEICRDDKHQVRLKVSLSKPGVTGVVCLGQALFLNVSC